MKKGLLLVTFTLPITFVCFAQNVGIGNPAPTEKLHVDSGSIKIGKSVWNAGNPAQFLKFGDADYITVGEEEADDKLTIRAKELLIRPSAFYTTIPVSIQGTVNYSHFYFGSNEDTYIRAGKNNANVIINDITGGKVGIGMSNPARAMVEQNGSVGNTSAIFGGNATGVSLQSNLPAIGLNQYFDGFNNRSISSGYASQLGLDQSNGVFSLKIWSAFSVIPDGFLSNSYTQKKFSINRYGKVLIGITHNDFADPAMPDLYINQNGATPSSGYNRTNGISLGYSPTIGDQNSLNLSVGDLTDGPIWVNALKIFGFPAGGPVAMIHPNTGQYIQLSDRQAKKDIRGLEENTLQKLMKLRPSAYHMINDTEGAKLKYGFVSQEVENVFPDIVFQSGNYKMLSYESFIPIAIKGIQEQQQQIETLEKENTSLKESVLGLTEKINALQKQLEIFIKLQTK